jgi:hypothetical protein
MHSGLSVISSNDASDADADITIPSHTEIAAAADLAVESALILHASRYHYCSCVPPSCLNDCMAVSCFQLSGLTGEMPL